jgi:L-cysteine:1D-myo-inositol 2-amino-2-deoxy-alpha-D-glucopyranoside ligase
MVHYADEKMSKSVGNLVMIRDLLERWPVDAIRLALTRHHYRADLTWTDQLAAQAQLTVQRWAQAAAVAPSAPSAPTVMADRIPVPEGVAALRESALAALDDDLDTPRVVTTLDQLAELALASDQDPADREAAGTVLGDLATRILGLRLEPAA